MMQTGRREYLMFAAVEPERMLSTVGNDELEPIAELARRYLVRVVEVIEGS